MNRASTGPSAGRRRLLLAGAGAIAAPAAARAQAPAWPSRPVRLVVPFPPGGSNDVIARPLAERMQARLGQPVVVENRPGAGGAIGAGQVAQAPPDGHTLLLSSLSFVTASIVQRTGWDPEGSFDAVTTLARAPFFLMVNPSVPAQDVQALVRLGKERPGGLDYGSSGAGGINHFISEYFCQRAGIAMNHIPYRGTAPAVTDLVAGHIQVMITTVASASAAIREGRVRLLAATAEGAPPTEGVPEVTTVRQQGVDYEVDIWWGLFAPKGLPPEVRGAIHAAAAAALSDPAVARIYGHEGARPAPSGQGEFPAVLRADLARWRGVAQLANIRAE